MPEIKEQKLSPQDTLMNCLADADRIEKVVIIVKSKESTYEYWSNSLEMEDRLGLIEICRTRIKKAIKKFEDVD